METYFSSFERCVMVCLTHPLANGQIRFSREHSLETVIGYAEEWKQSEDLFLTFIGVRPCGSSTFGIVFAYDFAAAHSRLPGKKAYEKFVYKLTDKLKRRFGNDVNWDISSSYHVIQ